MMVNDEFESTLEVKEGLISLSLLETNEHMPAGP